MSAASGELPTFRLSSREIGGAAALRGYQDATGGVFGTRPDGIVSLDDFRIDLHAMHLGSLLMARVSASAQRFERSPGMIAATGTDHIYVVRYDHGGSVGAAGGRDYRVRAGDISFLDLSRPRETRSDDFSNVTLVMPRALLEAEGIDIDALHGFVLLREEPLAAVLSAHLDALVRHADALPGADAETIGRATVALIASLVGRRSGTVPPSAPLSARREMMRYIDTHLGDAGLGPARLIETFGVSRSTLYRMFEAEGGVAEIVRSRRLAGAARLLGSTGGQEHRISEIARRMGFTDVSAFSRAFRARYGIAPSDARGQSAAFWAGMRGAAGDADLGRWVRTLRQ